MPFKSNSREMDHPERALAEDVKLDKAHSKSSLAIVKQLFAIAGEVNETAEAIAG